MARRVVVTGLGVVTALGRTLDRYWSGLVEGKSGVSNLTLFDTTDFKVHFGGQVHDWDADTLFGSKEARRLDRFAQFALVAVIVPWTIRNADVLGRLVPISTGGGKALYVGTFLPADGEYQRVKAILYRRQTGRSLPPQSEALNEVDPTPLFDHVAETAYPDLPRDTALGRIGKENFSKYFGEDPVGYLAMTVRVPSAKFDDTLTRLGELGKQTNLSRGVEDVTTQVIDVDARIAAQQASVRRLETLMGKAESLSDIVALEGELTRRQADLDSLKGQQAWLRDQTSMATISITLSTPDTHPNGEPNGFVAGVKRGWAGLGQAIGAGLTILGLLLPFLVLALIVGVPLWWVRRNRKAARQAPVSPATPAQTE